MLQREGLMGALDFRLPPHVTQNATVHKASVSGPRGAIVTQSRVASEVGLAVLDAGGTAADAAVAAAFVLASAEPWNSGLGGIGFGLVHTPDGNTRVVDFGPVAPLKLQPGCFPLTGEVSRDIFAWPEVVDARNVNGPLSFCVPSAVAGYGLLHRQFGRLAWQEILMPAVSVARRGLAKDWFTTLKIAQSAAILRQYEESARLYLPNGTVPIPPEQGAPGFLLQGGLAETIERIRVGGAEDFYRGELAQDVLADMAKVGAVISAEDLAACRARTHAASTVAWPGFGKVHGPGPLTAAPTFADVVARMPHEKLGKTPDRAWYVALATALREAYRARLAGLGDKSEEAEASTCTTHLAVRDAEGMVVALTTTLLGTMGSRLVLPGTGILMNNGAMWFDPRPDLPNSVGGGKRPLTNMLPVVAVADDGRIIAAGASGGRRILSSVYQILSHVIDFDMDLHDAAHQPRIDVSGPDRVMADRRLDRDILAALSALLGDALEVVEHGPVPLNFACPSLLLHDGAAAHAIADTMTPWSTALAQ